MLNGFYLRHFHSIDPAKHNLKGHGINAAFVSLTIHLMIKKPEPRLSSTSFSKMATPGWAIDLSRKYISHEGCATVRPVQ
jgi:hypothetical protein